MTPIVPPEFFKKDQEQLGQLLLDYGKERKTGEFHHVLQMILKYEFWKSLPDVDMNGSTLQSSLQEREAELAGRAGGGDRYAAALIEEREKTGTERGFVTE